MILTAQLFIQSFSKQDPRAYKQFEHPGPKKRPFCNAFTGKRLH